MPILSPLIDLPGLGTFIGSELESFQQTTPSSQVNTSPQILPSTLILTTNEFKRAYNLIKKVAKGKLGIETLFVVPP